MHRLDSGIMTLDH